MTLNNHGLGFPGLDISRLHSSVGSFIDIPTLRSMETIAERFGVGASLAPASRYPGLHAALRVHDSFASLTTRHSALGAIGMNSAFADLMQQHRTLLDSMSVGSLAGDLQARFGLGSIPPLMRSLAGLEHSLTRLMPESSLQVWQQHLGASVGPLAAAFSDVGSSPFAVLATVSTGLEASITWFEDEAPRSAALIRPEHSTRLRHLQIEPDIKICCGVCDEPMQDMQGDLRWKGNRWVGRLRVIPICASCLSKSGSDLRGYAAAMLECLDDLTKVPLRLVTGGESDGVARGRGRLRLVRKEEESD